jgi:putative Mn2+ efflux pump MntP
LDSVDRVIWILPVLAVLDVASTLYVEGLGFPLISHEAGFFAGFFVRAGLVYVYIPLYLLLIIGVCYILWFIKNKKLDSSNQVDKVFFVLLVLAACFIYVNLTAAFIVNFLLPSIVSRGIDEVYINLLIYASSAFSLGLYLWGDVVVWVKGPDEEKQ